jgi:hypothetical protein
MDLYDYICDHFEFERVPNEIGEHEPYSFRYVKFQDANTTGSRVIYPSMTLTLPSYDPLFMNFMKCKKESDLDLLDLTEDVTFIEETIRQYVPRSVYKENNKIRLAGITCTIEDYVAGPICTTKRYCQEQMKQVTKVLVVVKEENMG